MQIGTFLVNPINLIKDQTNSQVLKTPENLFYSPLNSYDSYHNTNYVSYQPTYITENSSFNLVSNLINKISSGISAGFKFIGNSALKIVIAAKNMIGEQFRSPSVDYGRLACAKAVSTALTRAGLLSKESLGCENLKEILKKEGYKSYNFSDKIFNPYIYQPGDVVFFAKGPSGHGHVGIISKIEDKNGKREVYMVHNSSSKREVVEINLNKYDRYPISIYRK